MRAPGLLRTNRDFRLLWFGESVSELGSTVTLVALPFVALLVVHASAFQVAALTAAETICWPFIALPVGVWVDRMSRRRILLVADGGRAIALSSIPIAAALGDLTLAQLYVVGAVNGVLTVFFSVAYPSFLPTVVDTADLVAGNSLLTGAEQVAHVTGPGVGGALVQGLGAAYALIVDALSFVVSVAALLAMRPAEPPRMADQRPMRQEIGEGVRFLVHHKVLRAFIAAAAISNFFAGGTQAIWVVFLVRTVHLHAGVIGLLFSIGSLGGVVGALLVRRFISWWGDGRTLVAASVVEAVCAFAVPAAGPGARLVLFCAGVAMTNLAIVAFNVVAGSYRQEVIPARLMGRAIAANRMVTWGALPLGSLTAGALAATMGLRPALWVLATGLILAPLALAAAGLFTIRTLPRVTAEPPVSVVATEA